MKRKQRKMLKPGRRKKKSKKKDLLGKIIGTTIKPSQIISKARTNQIQCIYKTMLKSRTLSKH